MTEFNFKDQAVVIREKAPFDSKFQQELNNLAKQILKIINKIPKNYDAKR